MVGSLSFYAFGILGLVWVAVWFVSVSNDHTADSRLTPRERVLIEEISPGSERPSPLPWRRVLAEPAVRALVISHFCTTWCLYNVSDLAAELSERRSRSHRRQLGFLLCGTLGRNVHHDLCCCRGLRRDDPAWHKPHEHAQADAGDRATGLSIVAGADRPCSQRPAMAPGFYCAGQPERSASPGQATRRISSISRLGTQRCLAPSATRLPPVAGNCRRQHHRLARGCDGHVHCRVRIDGGRGRDWSTGLRGDSGSARAVIE